MTIAINYKASTSKIKTFNSVLFVDEKFNILTLKKHLLSSEFIFISDLIKTKDLQKKIIAFDISSKKKIILVSLKKNITNSEAENLGGEFYDLFKEFKQKEFSINSNTVNNQKKKYNWIFFTWNKIKILFI